VLPFDLDLLRFDNIVHVGVECEQSCDVWKAKNSPKFHSLNG